MKIQYLLLRLIRHYMPEDLARFLLKMEWIIRPAFESSDPLAAVDQSVNSFQAMERILAINEFSCLAMVGDLRLARSC